MKSKGFTLIELVISIIILGILSATAIPQFLNFQTDTRGEVLKQVEGTLRTSGSMTHMQLAIAGLNDELSVNANTEGFPDSLKKYCDFSCYFAYGYPSSGYGHSTIEALVSGIGGEENIVYAGHGEEDGDKRETSRFSFRDNVTNIGTESASLINENCYVWYKSPSNLGGSQKSGVVQCQ